MHLDGLLGVSSITGLKGSNQEKHSLYCINDLRRLT
jgi:hypothetical protein